MTIQVAGSDLKCRIVYENILKALTETGINADVIKVTEIDEIVNMGVIMTPAISVDGEVKAAGKILTKGEIISILKGDSISGCSSCSSGSCMSGPCCS